MFFQKDGEICVIVHGYGNKTPEIVQFRKADWLYDGKHDYFLCIAELFYFSEHGIDVKTDSDVNPSFCPLGIVRYWKSLDLPEDIDRNIKEIIAYWFEEGEE